MSGRRPWSEIRRDEIEQRFTCIGACWQLDCDCRTYDGARNGPVPPLHDGCCCLISGDGDTAVEQMVDSVPSYEDLPEFVPWLDREGLKREDFAD